MPRGTTETGRSRRARVGRVSVVSLLAHLDPIAVVGIFLSIVLSLTLELTNVATSVQAILVGLGGITISLLLDATARAERRFQLRSLFGVTPWLTEALFPVAEDVREIATRYPDSPILAEARRTCKSFHNQLEELRQGRIIRGRVDYEFLLNSTRACQNTMQSVTNILPKPDGSPSWWVTEIGRTYWEANREAMARGVSIVRIFGYVEMTDEIERILDTQRQAGVKVGLLRHGAVDPTYQVNLALWDGTSAWEGRMNPVGDIIANLFTVNEHDLERLRNVFQVCRSAASFSA